MRYLIHNILLAGIILIYWFIEIYDLDAVMSKRIQTPLSFDAYR